jgi:hypothetical protein
MDASACPSQDYAERYMVHQQGIQGAIEHYTHPERVAWQSMCATDEGVLKGEQWCRKCIWRNLLPQWKRTFGSVEKKSSGDFVGLWTDRAASGKRRKTPAGCSVRSHIAFRLLEGRIPHPTPYGSDFSAIQVRGKVVRNHRRKSDTEEFAARCRESYFCDRFSHAWNRALNHDSGFGFAGLLLPVRTRRAVDAKARGGRCNRASKRGGLRRRPNTEKEMHPNGALTPHHTDRDRSE